MVDLMAYALEFIQVAGLLAVFILLVLDGAMLMPALPGEIIVIIAIAAWGTDPAGLALVFAIAVAAAVVGALLLYWIGAAASGRALRKRKSVLGIGPKRLEKMHHTFSRPTGQVLLFFGRLFPLTRVVVSLPAGIARMPLARYTLITTLGTVLFYAAFLWVAQEFRDPDSEIKATADGVQAAYATPAMDYVEANWIISAAILLVIAIVMTVRASRKMARDPEESGATLIGFAATLTLVVGGAALLAGMWMDPELVYEGLQHGGVDATGWSLGLPFEPDSILVLIGTLAVLIGLWLHHVRLRARARHRTLRKRHDRLAFQGRLQAGESRRGGPKHRRSAAVQTPERRDWEETVHASKRQDGE